MGVNRRHHGPATPGVAHHRASYPSGAWLDAFGNPAPSPNAPAAGGDADGETKRLRAEVERLREELKRPLPQPDPNHYRLLRAEEHAGYTVLELHYPDCTNYEGRKILVFQATLVELVNQRTLDPHFFEHEQWHSPLARFRPTDAGWEHARAFVRLLAAKPPGKRAR